MSFDATQARTTPNTSPSVTSCATNSHHTKSSSVPSDAVKASTAGSASPSLSPDSRFSEWRTRRGTRGFVTTDDDSTGSVGESSAPSRQASSQPRPTTQCATTATSAPVIGIASASFRNGRRQAFWSISASTSRPSRNRITIRATTARSCTKPERGSKSSTSRPPWPRANPVRTNTAASDRNDRRTSPDTSAPTMSSAPRTSRTISSFTGIESPSESTRGGPHPVRMTVLGKSPSWQDADGACSGYLIEEDGFHLLLDCGNGVFSKLRRFIDYVDIDAVVISHLHADHFLDLVPFAYALTYAPRQQPVPVARWPGTDAPARPRLIAPEGAGRTFRRIVGAWGKEDLIDDAFRLEEYAPDSSVEVGELRASFHEVPHFAPTFAIDFSSRN